MGSSNQLIKFSISDYFHWLENLLLKVGVDPHLGLNLIFVSIVIIVISYFAGKKYRQGKIIEPELTPSFVSALSIAVISLYEITKGQIGNLATKLFWLIGSFFIFILSCNLWGLLPGFLPPTETFSLTLGIGIISFLIYNYLGIKTHGFKYIKQFLGPLIYIAPLIFLIELVSHLVRPLTLGLRLFGNITGDHFVVSLFTEQIFPILLPVPFLALGVFIALVQAFVFFQLSLVYILGSVSDDH